MTTRDEFMAGYHREPTMGAQLEVALAAAMRALPEQRLGQIIANFCLRTGASLFNVYDEDMLVGLRAAADSRVGDPLRGLNAHALEDDCDADD